MKGTGAMFGKTEWFQPKVRGWGLRPRSWQGWLYALAWGSVISLPFGALVTLGRVPEAAIWVLATGVWLVWDVRQIVVTAATVAKVRRPTRPTKASRARRLDDKRAQSAKKRLRSRPAPGD